MSNDQNQKASKEASSLASRGARRRFVRGIGIATPVVLTMASRSVLGATGCLSPSAQASIALDHSRPNRDTVSCSGKSPGFWKEAANSGHPNHQYWVASGAEGKLFSTVFGSPDNFSGKTLKEVLQNGNAGKKKESKDSDSSGAFSDPDELGAHLCAAWCNLQTGKVPASVLTLIEMQQMWHDHLFGFGYHPVPGATWYGADIVTYIKTTFWG